MARELRAIVLAVVTLLSFSLAAQAVMAADSPAAADGERKVNAGDYRGAISTLQSALSQNPGDAGAYYWMGRGFYELRDYDNAISALQKAIALAPQNSDYHNWLGRAYGGKADREHSFFVAKKVKAEFQAAVRLDPSNIQARRDLEEYCISAPWIVGGSKDEALAQVNAIAAIDPVEGHAARAMYYNDGLKKPAQAAAEYQAILRSGSTKIEPYLEAANFFINQDQPANVLAAVNAAAGVAGNDARLDFYRGVLGVLDGTNMAAAERYLKSYVASTPDRSNWPNHASARFWLGRLYEAMDKPGAAAEQYRAALQLDPNRKDARARLNKLAKSQ